MDRISSYKRCGCRDGDGKPAGPACPQLRRRDGVWNPNHGTWYGKAELGRAPDGKRVTLQVGGFPTSARLEDWFSDALRLLSIPDTGPDGHAERTQILGMIRQARKTGAPLPDYDDLRRRHAYGAAYQPGTTGEFLVSWLAQRKEAGDIAPTTLNGYTSHIDLYWLPGIGDIALDKLRPSHITAVFAAIDAAAALRRAAAGGRRPTGPVTRQRIRATLRKALADARRAGLIASNPAGGESLALKAAPPPELLLWTRAREKAWRAGYDARLEAAGDDARKADRFRVWQDLNHRPSSSMVWRLDQLGAFLDFTEGDWLYPAWHVIAHLGLRRGEACGLCWADLDLATGTLHVRKNRVQVGWAVQEGDPKSRASRDTVVLDDGTVGVLTAWSLRQREEADRWGAAWTDTGHVLTREDGRPWHPSRLTGRFEHDAWQAGLPPARLHDLRHGAATIAHAAGAEMKDIQRLLRHSSYTITANLYTTIFEEQSRELAEKMAGMVPRRGAGVPQDARKGRAEL